MCEKVTVDLSQVVVMKDATFPKEVQLTKDLKGSLDVAALVRPHP